MTLARLVPTVSLAVLKESAAGGSAAVSPRPSSTGLASPSPRGGEAPSAGSVALQVQQQQQQGPPPQHALTLDRVRACSRRGGALADAGGSGPPPPLEHWPFTGGQPAASLASGSAASAASVRRHPSALYLSGHRDGRVRVWDATTQVPELLLTIPTAAGQERLRAVTAMEVGLAPTRLHAVAGVPRACSVHAAFTCGFLIPWGPPQPHSTCLCCSRPEVSALFRETVRISAVLRAPYAGGPLLRHCDCGPRRRRCAHLPVLRLPRERAPHEH